MVRTLTYGGRTTAWPSPSALFVGLCHQLKEAGALALVYPQLAALQRRTLQQGQPLGLEDVDSVLRALADRLTPGTGPALGGPQFVLKVQGTGEKMAYHRELVFNLVGPKPLLTLGEEALTETLTAVFQPRVFTAAD
ncbi:MAG TPA: hypothetical protein VMB23_08490, partial [Spirochaetia bacterium]|nr:hypothetical protein [Spirochaetia bacterium]